MLSITYGYARVSKAGDEARNLDTQLKILAEYGIREDLIFSDVNSGRIMNQTSWMELMSRVQLSRTSTPLTGVNDAEILGYWGGSAVSSKCCRTGRFRRRCNCCPWPKETKDVKGVDIVYHWGVVLEKPGGQHWSNLLRRRAGLSLSFGTTWLHRRYMWC